MLIICQAEKEKSELKESGISTEDTPLDKVIKNKIDRMRESEEEQENQYNQKFHKNKIRRKVVEDMRLKAMKSLTEIKHENDHLYLMTMNLYKIQRNGGVTAL